MERRRGSFKGRRERAEELDEGALIRSQRAQMCRLHNSANMGQEYVLMMFARMCACVYVCVCVYACMHAHG
jgi:hypothetical protein